MSRGRLVTRQEWPQAQPHNHYTDRSAHAERVDGAGIDLIPMLHQHTKQQLNQSDARSKEVCGFISSDSQTS